MTFLRELLATPFRLRGRTVGVGLDCLGVTLALASSRGVTDTPDPWRVVAESWARGELPPANGFPPGWQQVDAGAPQDDDVALFTDKMSGAFVGVGYVLGGHIFTASASTGVYRAPAGRFTIAQLWRESA